MKAQVVSLFRLSPYVVLLYTIAFPVAECAGIASGMVPIQVHKPSEGIDLASFLQSRTQKHDEIFTEALQLLENLNCSSSCNKLAATKLVSSCTSIGRRPEGPGNPDAYLALETVRSLYAARLAICEISGAGRSVPAPCSSINGPPPPRRGFWGRPTQNIIATDDYDQIQKADLEPCLRDLESRPQWWTSYSNSKQNAVVICQASRTEIDKEDILETYHSILQSSVKLSNGLHEALRMAAEESAKSRAFAEAIELLREEALRDIEKSTSSLMEKVTYNLETGLSLFSESISSALERIQLKYSGLENEIENSQNSAKSLQHMLQYMHEESLLRSEQIAMAQQQNAKKHNELAISLQSKLNITQDDFAKLEASVSERLRGIDLSLEDFQLRADNLDQVQQRQYEIMIAQTQAQQELQDNMRISNGILDQTMSRAANLQATFDGIDSAVKATIEYVPDFLIKLLTWLRWASPYILWLLLGIAMTSTLLILFFLISISLRYLSPRRAYPSLRMV
ncbi:putative nuclear membrane fusion protein Kar5 [Aspergillus mulundensis]|uniref:Nuclear membrane fusion protein Kar5 n=1 Tax=Aspergillus mulundensis TaxID=1810919 RepID=A0A3D8S5H7_9EURO|nr:hypothetical protein DSM5745_05007 [Aspergillus mulundensis]RDW81450.1 hypothetical protein DSM5745_05007 [Aspergillus mulundensis]